MKKRFDLIEHTADIGIKAYGQTLSEAFSNAAYGLFSIITDLRKVRTTESRIVEIRAEKQEDLLFEWLNQLIYYFDAEQLLIKKCDIQKFNINNIKAVCYGEKADLSRHKMKLGVKAATYHRLKVDPQQNQVEVILDI
jgi:SHS2 domain-containing protein